MKNIAILFAFFFLATAARSQDIEASLAAARTAYDAEKPQEARQNLQQALIDLNILLGKKILALMPAELGGLPASTSDDNIIGGTGFAGLMVSRHYGNEASPKIEITLANDSPMMSMVSSFLSNDMLSGIMASQTGQKRVMVQGYKGMLEKTDGDEGPVIYTLNVPLNDTLFTFETTGIASESEVLALAQQIELRQIAALLQ